MVSPIISSFTYLGQRIRLIWHIHKSGEADHLSQCSSLYWGNNERQYSSFLEPNNKEAPSTRLGFFGGHHPCISNFISVIGNKRTFLSSHAWTPRFFFSLWFGSSWISKSDKSWKKWKKLKNRHLEHTMSPWRGRFLARAKWWLEKKDRERKKKKELKNFFELLLYFHTLQI